MKKHEQWSNKKSKSDLEKQNISEANNRPASPLFILFFFLCFGLLVLAVLTQVFTTNRQTEEVSLADKAFLAGDYKKAEAGYTALVNDLHEHHFNGNNTFPKVSSVEADLKESYAKEKLALAELALNKFDDAEKNLDSALEMHINFIDRPPKASRTHSISTLTSPSIEAKQILRILNNKSQLFYLEKRHLTSEAEALNNQIEAIKQLPKEERSGKYLTLLKEQRPPENAQLANCDFGVFNAH